MVDDDSHNERVDEALNSLTPRVCQMCPVSQNKIFIYRGKEYEFLEDFSLRLLSQFPNAVRMTSTAPPGDSICNSQGQRILLSRALRIRILELSIIKCSNTNPLTYLLCFAMLFFQSSCVIAVILLLRIGCLLLQCGRWVAAYHLVFASLTGLPDIQCFMVKPVLTVPKQFKDKGVPEQILK